MSLLLDPRVESLNPGRVNEINSVSKFSIICKSFTSLLADPRVESLNPVG